MRRWGNQADARRGEARLGDPRIHFFARQLAPLAWLGALGHFDLKFLRLDEVLARDAESSGSDLLDGGILRVALFVRPEVAFGVFAAFAGVALATEAVHRDGERLVRFFADRAIGHRARL